MGELAGRRVPPRGAELCHCLGVEEGGEVEAAEWKRNVLSSVVLLELGMSRGRAQRGCGVPTGMCCHSISLSGHRKELLRVTPRLSSMQQWLSLWTSPVGVVPGWLLVLLGERCHCWRGSLSDSRSGEGWLDAESILKDAGMPMPSESLLV